MLSRALAAAALTCALAACAHRAGDRLTTTAVVTPASPSAAALTPQAPAAVTRQAPVALTPQASTERGATSSYETALRAKQSQLAEQDRASAAQRRAEVARVVTGTARDVTPASSMVERFVVRVTNHGGRAIRRIDGGVTVYGGPGLHRLGLASFSANTDIPPHGTMNVSVAIPWTAFAAEGAGALARTSGSAKRVELELTGYRLENGSSSGETE